MRPTFFAQQQTAIKNHIRYLELLVSGNVDSSIVSRYGQFSVATYQSALEAMQIIEKIADEQTPLFTKTQINALLSIPAITQDWSSVITYLNLSSISLDRQERFSDFLNEVTKDRNNEKQNLLLRPSGNRDEDNLKWDKLSKETDLLHLFRHSIYSIRNSVPEFSVMSKLIEKYASFKSCHQDREVIMPSLCRVIANADDPKLALQQALRYADSIDAPSIFFWALKPYEIDSEKFNQFLDTYQSKAVNAPQYR